VDPKALNAIVHDREAAYYDDRFLIDYDGRIGAEVRRDLGALLGEVPRARRALDVACGTGYLAVGLAASGIAREVHATDLSVRMVERTAENAARAGASLTVALADAERLPYADAAFDLVVARAALHHLPDPAASLREIRRVLEPGGIAIVTAEPTPGGERQVAAVVGVAVRAVGLLNKLRGRTQDPEHLTWELASMAANLHTFTPDEIESTARAAGFEQVEVSKASLAWILALGINYYLVGEFDGLARNRWVRRGARASADAAAAFDRAITDRFLPASWRHTIQAVMR